MPFGPDGPAVGSRAAFSGPVVGHGRSGRRGEKHLSATRNPYAAIQRVA